MITIPINIRGDAAWGCTIFGSKSVQLRYGNLWPLIGITRKEAQLSHVQDYSSSTGSRWKQFIVGMGSCHMRNLSRLAVSMNVSYLHDYVVGAGIRKQNKKIKSAK